jgi:hypothetical protein
MQPQDRAGIGGSSRRFWIFRPSGECAAVGRGRRKIHRDETSAVPAAHVAADGTVWLATTARPSSP